METEPVKKIDKMHALTPFQYSVWREFYENRGITAYGVAKKLNKSPFQVATTMKRIEECGYVTIATYNGKKDFSKVEFKMQPKINGTVKALRDLVGFKYIVGFNK